MTIDVRSAYSFLAKVPEQKIHEDMDVNGYMIVMLALGDGMGFYALRNANKSYLIEAASEDNMTVERYMKEKGTHYEAGDTLRMKDGGIIQGT